MRIIIGEINLLSVEDWISHSLPYWLIGGLICIYCLYYICVELISDAKNKKTRYGIKIETSLDTKDITQYTIEQTRDFFSQLHALSIHYYTNEIIGLNIFNISGKLETYLTSTSKDSTNAISEAISKNKTMGMSCGPVFVWSEHRDSFKSDNTFRSQVKIQKREFPLKSDSLTFASGLLESILETPNSGISFTILPYEYQSKFDLKIRQLLQHKQSDRGLSYVPEHNKLVAKQLQEKNKQPLFLSKIEVFAPDRSSVKQLTSKFNSLSTGMNKFYSYGAVEYKKKLVENRIHCEYWFGWFMPKPHFYLNSAELACLWQPIKLEGVDKQTRKNNQRIYSLSV